MQTSPNGRAFIEAFEGLILKAYDDVNDRVVQPGEHVAGTLTIGYGHTSAAGPPKVVIGMAIDHAEADGILATDLVAVEMQVAHLVKPVLNQDQFDALVSFQFNTGWLGHPNCSLLKALNAGNFALAENDFALFDMAGGKVLAGLQRRRAAEKLMFEGQVAAALKLAGAKVPAQAAPQVSTNDPPPQTAPKPAAPIVAAPPAVLGAEASDYAAVAVGMRAWLDANEKFYSGFITDAQLGAVAKDAIDIFVARQNARALEAGAAEKKT
jgi:lysozyme